MTYGDYKLWPMGGRASPCDGDDQVDYRGEHLKNRRDLEIEREAELATQDGRMSQLCAMDYQQGQGVDVPDFQGPNSRACDEVLRPYGGQPAVVRGAEALNESRRLAAIEALRIDSGDSILSTETLSSAAEAYLTGGSSSLGSDVDGQLEPPAARQVNA